MGKPFWRSVEYFFTGNYSGDEGNNKIAAIGFGGKIYARGGDDYVTIGSIGATVYTGSGNDTVVGGAAYLRVEDSVGNLNVTGAAGYADIDKSGDGNVSFVGAAGGVSIDHLGNRGDVNYGGVAAYNGITRKGLSGHVTFGGAGGYNSLWHETNQGNLSFTGAGAGNKLDRTWFNQYQGSRGNVIFNGVGAANSISSRVETGHIIFRGAGADNHLVRKGKVGDITFVGAGASNRIERTRQSDDIYAETCGNIRFVGVGGYNSIYSDVAHGDIHFSGGGAYNKITRKGSGNDFKGEGLANANASEIVLTAAQMHGLSIGNGNKFHSVKAIKSEREANTYLFAIADGTYTKINKIRLYNDSETGNLKYYSEAWYKRGNHLASLARSDVSGSGGFESNPVNGGYTLSNIELEHQQVVTIQSIEKDLTEHEWVTYAEGALIDAKDITLLDAKMSGYAISEGLIDVTGVKSNVLPNTYIFAKVFGRYTKIVTVELRNDKETGSLQYRARGSYRFDEFGTKVPDLADEYIPSSSEYKSQGVGAYSLSDLHYSVNAVRSTSETVADIDEYTDQNLFKPATGSGKSSGDVHFTGVGGGNVIKSNVTLGDVHFNGGGIANVVLHSSKVGDTKFIGGGAANVIVKSGDEGNLIFRGAGLANVLVHQSKQGKMDVYAGGAVNVLIRIGDGEYLAHLLAYGNVSVHKGNGNSRLAMLGGYNTHTQIGSGNGLWLAGGGFNVMTQIGKGDIASVLVGGANVITKVGDDDLTAGMLGGANIITHISDDATTSNTTAVALGGANILTKKGKGDAFAVMGGGTNVLTHIGDGTTTGVMVGGANILTKVGDGDTTGIMLGIGNVLTHVGDGQTLGVMGAAGNIFTKVGDSNSIAVMIGVGNIFTHVGEENAWALMGGLGNVFTKVGNDDALALMVAEANVFTHIGNGTTVALMVAKGNIATKVGNGTSLAAMVGNANIFTHVGNGSTFAAMLGQASIMTKVGNDLTAALMIGNANIYTHVGNDTSIGLFVGELNVMTKVGNGTTLAAMFGKASIMTHVGNGLTGVLALSEANIITKVGDDFMGVVAVAKANVVTHVGDATTAALLAGKGNILTKVGEGTTVGLLISQVGNIMTHIGDGATVGLVRGKANIVTKVGDGLGVNAAWGHANILTHVGDGDRYNFAKGDANIITKVGDGQEVSVVQGKANVITHVGNGDDYTGSWAKANIITKVGDGRNVVLAKGEANIVTQVGDGDSFNALWSKGNIVTKVGDGIQVTAAKGKANITTTVGNGLSVTATYADANINTKIGDGTSVNVAWGKYNVNTKVGDGLNVSVMKGKANVNVHVGDGLGINASYARNNVAIKVGNGDFYSLAVSSSNTSSNKLSTLFDNIKQTLLGVGGSQAINYLVQGDEASSSSVQKGLGEIATSEITKLDGFELDEIEEVGSDLKDSLSGSVTNVEAPDLSNMKENINIEDSLSKTKELTVTTKNETNIEDSSKNEEAPNLIVNGDFEQNGHGWESTHGIEAVHSAKAYGVSNGGHGSRVTELDVDKNTSIFQNLSALTEGEVIAVSFDFARRAGISSNEGIEVLWNGDVVFSTSGDKTAWQHKILKLTANSGSNKIEFKGTGHNDGRGYVLDNVVAKSEAIIETVGTPLQVSELSYQPDEMSDEANTIADSAEQNQAAKNAMSDKERAEADRQRLEQEKQKQLEAVSGSQAQLESTDQKALENNGRAQRDAVNEESEAVTKDLTAMAQGLKVLDDKAKYMGESGDHWRERFAGGLLDDVQTQLDKAKEVSGKQITAAKKSYEDSQKNVKDSVAKSEAGVAKGEQNRAGAEQDIANAKADADARKAEATTKTNEAKQAELNANDAARDAEERGHSDARNAENKASQAKADAKGSKQNENDRPDRQGASGSGLSNANHSIQNEETISSDVDTVNPQGADGRFSEGLTDQEQEALDGAVQAVNRLQINAGVRSKNTGSSITSLFTESNADSIIVSDRASQDVNRKDIRISGVGLEGLGRQEGRPKPRAVIVPEFGSHFETTSIGIENELSGLVVALPSNSTQKFGYVYDSEGNPLFMLTKDMNQGSYTNPAGITDIKGIGNWQTHTIELVTYPSETRDKVAVESRKDAMLWLAKEFTSHINQSNHKSLSNLVSEDGRFTLAISNSNHLIAAGNGMSIEAQGQTIGMTPSGQQASMAVSAKDFGTGSSDEVKLLESAPWYQSRLRDEFLANSNEHKLDDPAAAQNVYAYLTSVYSKTADLAKEYGIYINDWDPASEGFSPNAQGLTDPKVKNAWEILPRTKPVKMLELLSADDSRYVRQQIIEKLKGSYSESLAKSVFEYFQYGGEVAGHGINNATTGSVQQPESAILFEFRSVPSVLSEFVPKTESTAKVDVKALDHFDSASRKAIVVEVNALVNGSDDFDAWYQEYRASKGQPPVKKPKSSASANHKAEWLMTQYADKWAKITAPYIESNETSTSTQTAVDTGEVLKGLQEDFKRYGDALKPDTNVPGKSKDIRTTKDFLNGYKNDHAKDTVDGFHSDMSIKQLVDLFVKGNWSAEQKGALAWEIESRALKVTFQNKSEKYNRLFREIASAGVVDAKATEQLAPQLMLLNLSNDGFGGRCDPLSKLVLVAKQLENDGQVGVARQLLEKMYSAAAVLSNPTLYSDSEKVNASKLLSSLAAIHVKNPMHDTSMKVWQEKLEGKQALTVNGVVEKITDVSANGKPVLLELDAPDHAMAAWAKGSGDERVYGFYDPNAGIVEFSSAEKFGAYLTRFFGKSDLNMAQSYKLVKNEAGEAIFNRVVVMDGSTLASYKPTVGDSTTMQGILDLPVFDATPISKPEVNDALSGNDKHKENVAIENDGTPPQDKESLSPLNRFLNNELFGAKDARRKIGDTTETLLGFAVGKGESQKVTLKGEAGRLSGYFHKGAKAPEGEESTGNGKVVLFLHGSGSSSEEQASAIRSHYHKQNIDMLAVNMRGYGESDGGPSEKGLYQDSRTMFKYLVNDKGIDPSNIIIHGYSMGGPIAADLARFAAQNGQAVSGLLLDRPMPSMTKAITAHEVVNPAGIVGALSKAVNGQFSVEKNLKGLPKDTPIMLLTDSEGLGDEGEKLRAKLAIAGHNVTGEQTFYGHEASNRLMSHYADQIVSGLFNAEQAAIEAGEVLKGLQEDFKRYGDALKPDTNVPGKSKDIRTTKDFLNGYKNDHAKDTVDGFHSDMSIKQLVDLFVKGNWSAEQKGALAWEIESRALKVTFQNKSEKYNRLFREIASAGVVDAKATEQLAPQLMLLNLSNDGFGGRCDPLSKLVLVAKQLENDGQVGVARQLLEKMYSAAAVLSNPTLYSDSEKVNASKLLSSLAAIHVKNPMHDTSMKVWQEKLEGKQALTVNGVVEKITDVSANGKPVLLELDAPDHAMAAWAKGSGDERVYGFYDPNAGIVEFSSAEKFGAYLTRFFGKSDLNMAQSYKLVKNEAGEAIFNRVVVMDGSTLASYKPTVGDSTTMQGILDLPVFDATPISKPEVNDALSGNDKHKEKVAIENDGTPSRDKESLSPLNRFLNNELFGAKDARRKIGDTTETLLGLAVEKGESQKVTLKGEAGRLSGYFHKGAKAPVGEESTGNGKVVLFLHGSGSSSEEQASAIRSHYHKQGIGMLAVNLRGYGESDGGPSEKGLYQDARTMFKYLVNDKGIDPSNIIIHGYSMGGPIAADLARYAAQNGQAVSGLLLDRPMPSMTKAITAHEVANPAGIVGALSKAVNGQFSVEKNLKGLPKDTPIMLLTDSEGLGDEGEKLRAKLAIAGHNVTGEQTFYGHEASNRLMSQYADQIVSGLFNAEQAAIEAGEVLKGLQEDFKRYGDALKPDTNVPGKSKDIRTTKDFLNGYKNDHAKDTVDGFHSDMSIKQLVDLFVKGNWSAEQKGALAWEIESRALKVTFQNKSEKYNRLFREIASAGVVDAKATEQLAPQLMLLNLSNDGFGGRCDPLSKLVLVAKQLENDGQVGVARQLLEKMYSAAAVLSNPTLYSDNEKANASKLLSSLAAIHAKNPMHDTSMKVWQEKLEGKQALTVNGVVEKITDVSANGKPVLLELDAPGHAMAAWAKGSGEERVYGFYDPNAGIVEFSSAEKFGAYLTRFFGKSDLNMTQSYKLVKNDAGEAIFNRVVVMDGSTLASYKPTVGDSTTMQGILDLPVFDATPIKKPASDLEALGHKTKVVVDLSQIFTAHDLKERAKVFAKPIGASYQAILDQVELVHSSIGRDQVGASFELNKQINNYLAEHPTSGRNLALTTLKEQVNTALFSGKMKVTQESIDAIAQTRTDLAARIYVVAMEEANGEHVGLTDMMVRWANEDPYLSPKQSYAGETPSDLGFDAKYHIELGEQYSDFKQWLEKSQSAGLLSKAVLDDATKTVHLGYSYQELQDLTGVESVQMAFYFLKEAAKKSDPMTSDSAEMILLKKFADQGYISQLETDRMGQIEGIYRSSHETDVDSWDRRYSGAGYDELSDRLAGANGGVEEQLSVLLNERKGLLIGEVHGSDVNGLRFVNEQMDALKKQGVTVIGLEHLRSDLAQPLLDNYLSTGIMSSELSAMIKTKHLDITLFENARANGMRILALDANSTARPTVQGTEHGLMYRAGAANNVAVDALQALPDGEKFVAIYGKAHLQSHKGIESFVPGITHRLGLPALKVSASDQFVIEQDDKTLRAVYDDVANEPNIDFQVSLNGSDDTVKYKDVNSWERLVVSPQSDGGETRFEGQIIIQMENDSAVSKAAENLAGKHPDSTVVVQLDSDGNYRVIYGDPSKLPKDKLAGQLRWQLVGHGRDESENNNTHLSGYSADELAVKLAAFNKAFSEAENVKAKPDHISVVGCSLISDDKQNGFGRLLIQSMGDNDIFSDVSVRSSEVAVGSNGRKHTHDENGNWVQKEKSNKVTLSWDEQGEVTEKHERIRNGIAEGDIDLSRVGTSDVDDTARGAIAENSDVFNAPEKRKAETETSTSSANNKLSYSGNIQVNVGDGEFTAVNWGTSNVGIKVGTGGFKSLAFGDNNVMVHVGDGESKHSFDIGGYQALEGAQMFIGNRNVSFNLGQSNDLIVMMDKSIPTPPLVNPFGGASRISGVLKSIASSGEGQDWLAAQEQQWTLSGAKKFVKDMSGLDQTSSVDYTSLVDLDSQNERSSRGLKNDAEATLNKQYNQWLGGSDNSDSSKMSRADKFRQANEKLAFNFAVGGQGADIQVTTGNWNFMFGDNIQSILDTNLGSLFGLMTQQFSKTGQAKTTFTYSPEDLPRQLKNKLLGQLAGVGAETTLGDIFGVDYTAAGHIVSRTGESVDGVAILKEMLEVVGEFSGDQLQAFVDPAKLLDSLESSVNMGADGIKTFAETHGLKEKALEEEEDNSSVSVNGANVAGAQDNGDAITADSSAKEDRAFGFNSLNLPNLFATIFSENKQTEMKSLVEKLKENLTADLLNMKEKTFDFLRNSGHLQGDGDINVSLGNYNFNWGGDGKDLGAYLGDNNNFWGGRGDDVYYATGTSNVFTGDEGNDLGVLMGRENMMFGGEGNDTAVVAGRINHVFLGAGDDESFVFGEGGEIDTGTGRDYVVTSGNYNRVDTGGDQDYSVTIGNNNQVELGAGNDFANVFGNYNRINASGGNDVVKLMGYNAVLNGGEGDDHLIAAALSKFSQFNGGEGSDMMVLGGFQNTFKGGTGVDSFVVSGDVIDNLVEDIRSEDNIVFNGIDWQKLWLERSGYDLKLSILRDPESSTDQAKFEHIGSVTFNDYFNGNRAQVVVAMGDQGTSQDHTVLSNNAVDALVQAMSGFEPQVGDNGFIDNLDSKSRVAITTAWSDVSRGNSAIS